jgi:hypothetical protein
VQRWLAGLRIIGLGAKWSLASRIWRNASFVVASFAGVLVFALAQRECVGRGTRSLFVDSAAQLCYQALFAKQ